MSGVASRDGAKLTRESGAAAAETPLMQQYREIKARHPESILFFRMGDFYETFGDDAVTASRVLGITLTARNNGGAAEVPLAGVPVKAAPEYVRRLVSQGFRVAICEQVEDPKLAKGIVRREVVETVTPGAVFADDLLERGRNNFLCAVHAIASGNGDVVVGVAAADVSTGELRLALTPAADLGAVLARLAPRELLVTRAVVDASPTAAALAEARAQLDPALLVTERDAWEFDPHGGRDDLARQFGVLSLDGLGLGDAADAPAISAAGALLRYLRELQPAGVPHLARPVIERGGGTMPLDEMTRRNLELVESLRPASSGAASGGAPNDGTLLGVLDRTLTPMGARLLRRWLLAPLTARDAIVRRHDAVAALAADPLARAALRDALDGVRDVERLGSKAAAGRATPRDMRALGDSIGKLPEVEQALARVRNEGHGTRDGGRASGDSSPVPRPPSPASLLADLSAQFDACADLSTDIARTLVDRPPIQLGDEPTIAPGVDAELDELRALRDGGRDAIAE
ncbi:MAG TPA: hypothetical protein VNS52_20515, partial [Gemmatimonadaceae bacterium]|nr:hypothetical protein [Gemmatimonadaceae bacterium]